MPTVKNDDREDSNSLDAEARGSVINCIIKV